MAKKKRSGRRGSKKIPILATVGAGLFALEAYNGWQGKTGAGTGINGLKWSTLGIDNKGKFQMAKLIQNLTPVAVGVGGSILASKVKANRYVSIPMFKF